MCWFNKIGMKLFTFFSFLIFSFFSFSKSVKDDTIIHQIISNYQKAIITKDIPLAKNCFISQDEFKGLVDYVAKTQPNCIGTDENNFSTEQNDKAFLSVISSDIKINTVFINKIEYNNSCGDLFNIPRVICTVQYNNNKTVEVPFLLIKTINGDFKIIRNFLNIKMFSL